MDQIELGAILRIADAAEKMTRNHAILISERDAFKYMSESRGVEIQRLNRTISGLRGYIARLKKG